MKTNIIKMRTKPILELIEKDRYSFFTPVLYVTILLLVGILFTSGCGEETSVTDLNKEVFRGFDTSMYKTDAQLDSALAITGANLFRTIDPFVSKEPPYDFIERAFENLDRVLDWGERNGVRIVINPHTTPGTRNRWTVYPEDELWKDRSLWDHLIKAWVRIANEQKHRGDVIFGYDLLNEPAIPDPAIHGNQWNELVAILVDTIRTIDDKHSIIVEPAYIRISNGRDKDRIDGLEDLILPDDDNIIVSPHVYEPFAFTHQGVYENPSGVSYPGQIGNTYWDKDQISAYLQPIRDFQEKHGNIPIFIGEFSASRAGGNDSNVYLKDLIDLFEAEGWHWAYHDWRGGRMWDPEMPVGSNRQEPRDSNTPRMQLLKEYFSRN